jgi:hypothetical protein
MLIPGVPDNELERLHWNYGGGRGAIGLRHKPSGITVCRECLPDVPVSQLAEQLKAELEDKLRNEWAKHPAVEPKKT